MKKFLIIFLFLAGGIFAQEVYLLTADSAATRTDTINFGKNIPVMLRVPDSLAGTTLTFEITIDESQWGVSDFNDENQSEISMIVTAGENYLLKPATWAGVRRMCIVINQAQTQQVQFGVLTRYITED